MDKKDLNKQKYTKAVVIGIVYTLLVFCSAFYLLIIYIPDLKQILLPW